MPVKVQNLSLFAITYPQVHIQINVDSTGIFGV